MSKTSPKKGVAERRKKPRKAIRIKTPLSLEGDSCLHCTKSLKGEGQKALFVEEEIGRVFCSEECIAANFLPEIETLEREYLKNLSKDDLTGVERENLAHLRWIALEEADNVYRQKTKSGDFRYTLMAEFKPDNEKVWCVCICLFLRGEPSFLYLAFVTKNPKMVDFYRRGEEIDWVREDLTSKDEEAEAAKEAAANPTDGLANEWTSDETYRAHLLSSRSEEDIPNAEFGEYQACVDETLEKPDEVWSIQMPERHGPKLYHFIKHYNKNQKTFWFIIVAKEIEDEEEQLEIVDGFPTVDPHLVEGYRAGTQEVGSGEKRASGRVVH